MVGFPKHCNTKEDHLYVREHFPREQWGPVFQALFDERMAWLTGGKLMSKEAGKTSAKEKVVAVGGEDGVEKEYYQVEYKEDKNCKMLRLGFTAGEIEGLLS